MCSQPNSSVYMLINCFNICCFNKNTNKCILSVLMKFAKSYHIFVCMEIYIISTSIFNFLPANFSILHDVDTWWLTVTAMMYYSYTLFLIDGGCRGWCSCEDSEEGEEKEKERGLSWLYMIGFIPWLYMIGFIPWLYMIGFIPWH